MDESIKDDEVRRVKKVNILFLLRILVSTSRQKLIQKFVSHNHGFKLYFTSLMDFARKWYQYQDIPHLNLTLPPYAQ